MTHFPLPWVRHAVERRRRARQRAVETAAILIGILLIGYFWLMYAIYGDLP